MKTNLRIALSAIALAVLVAAPAFAKSHPQHDTQPAIYSSKAVVVDGKVIGADPDGFIRFEIRRDNKSYTRD
jgi:hypothetical protein